MRVEIPTTDEIRAIVREELRLAIDEFRQSAPAIIDWVTPAQAAPRFGVDEKTVRRWCESGRLRAERHGSRWRIDRAALPAAGTASPEKHGHLALAALKARR